MENIKLTIEEMYHVNAMIFGIPNVIVGFVNEPHNELKESVKRKVYKIGNITRTSLLQIDEQRKNIKNSEGSDEEKISKDKELLQTIEEIEIDKPQFSFIENISLPNNYQLLYDKIFKD